MELLYRTSRTLDEAPISETLLRRVLSDLRDQLGLGAVALCLRASGSSAGSLVGTETESPLVSVPTAVAPCGGCRQCDGPVALVRPHGAAADASNGPQWSLDLPVSDAERSFGCLLVELAPGQRLESWQLPLLESLAANLATALALRARMRESRRMVLQEERNIIARELHDSFAQALSYLKIQAARLDAALRARGGDGAASACALQGGHAEPAEILGELRAGISSAYRQLRELLTTFRLKLEGAGFGTALGETVQEFERRGKLSIRLRDRLPAGRLSANEKVHVLQIIREALSNVLRHADARSCRVLLGQDGGGTAWVAVTDDGRGLLTAPAGDATTAARPYSLHHGTTIMRESPPRRRFRAPRVEPRRGR